MFLMAGDHAEAILDDGLFHGSQLSDAKAMVAMRKIRHMVSALKVRDKQSIMGKVA
ncbi:hypothetical protein LBMAG52_40460 [Planctomycetia bacterium]|nr:hypothetical protein LBMAG52_40460 [Planctomycetia bacterium]